MRLLPAALLVCAGLVAYANSLSGPFIFDDLDAIVGNPPIRRLWPPGALFAAPAARSSVDGRPVLTLSLALNYAAGGLDPKGYHAVNLLIHLAAGLLLFGIVHRTLDEPPEAPWLALAAAGIWLLHPLQTESVTYVIQRAESLMGLLYLLTMYAALRDWKVLAVLACALGMATKEVMVTAPLLVVLYDRCFRHGSFREAWRQRWRFYLTLGATWGVLVACLAGGSQLRGAGAHDTGISPVVYLCTEARVILHYLRLAFWPDRLVLDYGWAPNPSRLQDLPAVVGVSALLGLTLWALVRRPALGFPGAAFFLILGPTSSVMPLPDPAFEHRMYLPLTGAVVLAVLGGRALLRRLGLPGSVQAALAGGLALGLCTLTADRNRDYHNPLAIWADTVAKRPLNYRARNSLGLALQAEAPALAMAEYREALRINPSFAYGHYNLGCLLARQGLGDEALAHLSEAARLDPFNALIRHNLGVLLARRGDLDGAIAQLSVAAGLAPADSRIRRSLAWARARRAGSAR